MDYEKKYRDLVEAVKTLKEANPSDEGIQNWVKDNVPELAVSEDEKIRKDVKRAISVALDYSYFDKETANNCLAWLEKQSQVKESTISQHEIETCKENDDSLTSEDETLRKALLEMVHDITGNELLIDYNIHKEDAIAWLEKQGERKPYGQREECSDCRFNYAVSVRGLAL